MYNAFIDLDAHNQQSKSIDFGAYSKASEEVIQHPSRKKRKLPTITGSLGDQSDQGGLEVDRSRNLAPITVRIAALEALEALLTVVCFCLLPESVASSCIHFSVSLISYSN